MDLPQQVPIKLHITVVASSPLFSILQIIFFKRSKRQHQDNNISVPSRLKNTRWAPTTYKWTYNRYQWLYKLVIGLFHPTSRGEITPFIRIVGAHLVTHWYLWVFLKMTWCTWTPLGKPHTLPPLGDERWKVPWLLLVPWIVFSFTYVGFLFYMVIFYGKVSMGWTSPSKTHHLRDTICWNFFHPHRTSKSKYLGDACLFLLLSIKGCTVDQLSFSHLPLLFAQVSTVCVSFKCFKVNALWLVNLSPIPNVPPLAEIRLYWPALLRETNG